MFSPWEGVTPLNVLLLTRFGPEVSAWFLRISVSLRMTPCSETDVTIKLFAKGLPGSECKLRSSIGDDVYWQ